MTQLQFYKYATWALLVINAAVLSFFLLTKPHPKGEGPGGPRSLENDAVQLLQLDEQQYKMFIELAVDHSQQLRSIEKEERDELRRYFDQLLQESNDSTQLDILEQVKLLEGSKVTITYKHFQEVKALLRPEQQEYFEGFMKKALRLLLVEERRRK